MLDDFIGQTFGKDNQITVLGWNGERTSNYTKLYTVKCNVCCNDPELYGSATWLITKFSLKKGVVSCGCSKVRRTKEQWLVLINRWCKSKEITFNGIAKENKPFSISYLDLTCKCGNRWKTKWVCCVVEKPDSVCPACAMTGFNSGKPSSVYVLKIVGKSGEFTGYGISTDILTRIQMHKTYLREYGFRIEEGIYFNTVDGKEALDIERQVNKHFEIVPQEIIGFKKESTHYEKYKQVIEFVSNLCADSPKQILL